MSKKRRNCKHDKVIHTRGPRVVETQVKEYDMTWGGSWHWIKASGPVIVEECLRCGRKREIPFD